MLPEGGADQKEPGLLLDGTLASSSRRPQAQPSHHHPLSGTDPPQRASPSLQGKEPRIKLLEAKSCPAGQD